MIFATLLLSNLISLSASQYGGFNPMGAGAMGGFGPRPMQNFPKDGVAEHQMAVMRIFPDSLDSKPLGQMIAAGMLPRYAPMHTDSYDAGEMWLAGMHGEQESAVIQRAKMMYPISAALHHPENPELGPMWGQVVAAGLNRQPGQPANGAMGSSSGFGPPSSGGGPINGGASDTFNPSGGGASSGGTFSSTDINNFMNQFGGGMGSERPEAPEMEAPEGYNSFNGFSGPSSPMGPGSSGSHGAMPFHPAMMEEHGEDICPTLTAENCHYPCMNFGGFCTGEMALRKFHEHLKASHSQDSTPKGFHLTHLQILYCAWGLTTGLVVGLLFEYRRRRKTTPEATDAFHAMA